MPKFRLAVLALFIGGLVAAPSPAAAQLGGLKKKIKQKVERAADKEVDEVLDKTENEIRCTAGDSDCIAKAKKDGKTVVVVNQDGDIVDPDTAASEAPGVSAVNTGFDFTPGDRVLFESDFAGENVGDFPRSLTWHRGNMEVVEWEGRRWVRATSANAALSIPLGEPLPERFTIEFDVYNPGAPYGMIASTGSLPKNWVFRGEPHLLWAGPARGGSGLMGAEGEQLAVSQAEVNAVRGYERAPVRARVMVDGRHMKVYWGDERIANAPQVALPRSEAVHLVFRADPSQPIYVGDIRIASGGRDLYAVLERDGRFTARGIHFDTGSDRIRPESKSELDEIGAVLGDHPNLELVVEGHTDSQGSEASNLDLSERRAASVRTYLIENYGVDARRLRSAGFGETRPVDSNGTEAGRQMNRRVEIVRAGAESRSSVEPPTKAVVQASAGPAGGTKGSVAAKQGQATNSAGSGPAIGYVEIEGVGRLDVHAAPDGATASDVLGAPLNQTRQPTAGWIDGQGRVVIYALAAPGATDRGWVHIEFLLATRIGSTTSDFQLGKGETVFLSQARGVVYHEPSSGSKSNRRHLGAEALTLEEISQTSDGRWSLRLRFEGSASHVGRNPTRAGQSMLLGEVPMSGVVEVEGIPVVR